MSFPQKHHRHEDCTSSAKARLDERAKKSGRRVTDNLKCVFSILLSDHRAIGVYDIAAVSAEYGKSLQPVQIYRALDTLMALGCAHRVESANAYLACRAQGECTAPQIMICTDCKRVAEMENETVRAALDDATHANGFVLQNQHVELLGLCPDCSSNASQPMHH
ncbi:MAG: transcriptional repressor [Pseudomonadota bacterium]